MDIGEGLESFGDSIGRGMLVAGERKRKRKASMALGDALSKPEVLDSIADEGFRESLRAIAPSMSAGDVSIDDAVNYLKSVPSRQLDPAIVAMLERNQPGGRGQSQQPAADSAGGMQAVVGEPEQVDTLEPRNLEEVPEDFEDALRKTSPEATPEEVDGYLRTINAGGIGMEFPVPERIADQEQRRAVEKIRAEEEARQSLAPMTQEASTVVASAENVMMAIDELVALNESHPGVMRAGLVPGAEIVGDDIIQKAELLLKTIRTEMTSAKGGKNLTDTEIKFIKYILPLLRRRDKANLQSLAQAKTLMNNIRRRILGPVRSKEAVGNYGGAEWRGMGKSKNTKSSGKSGFKVISVEEIE